MSRKDTFKDNIFPTGSDGKSKWSRLLHLQASFSGTSVMLFRVSSSFSHCPIHTLPKSTTLLPMGYFVTMSVTTSTTMSSDESFIIAQLVMTLVSIFATIGRNEGIQLGLLALSLL